MRVIAEVTRINVPVGGGQGPSEEANKLADEAAHAPGSEQLLTLVDMSTGNGMVIHLWNDEDAYEAWAARRNEMRAEAETIGGRAEPSQLYEVTYRS